MSISFRCEQCAKPFKLADEAAGTKARCKACGHLMWVPYGSEIGLIESTGGRSPYTESIDSFRLNGGFSPQKPPAYQVSESDFLDEPSSRSDSRASAPTTKPNVPSSGGMTKGLWALAALLFFIFKIYTRMNFRPGPPPPPRNFPPGPFPGNPPVAQAPLIPRANSEVIPPLPERTKGEQIEPGISFEVIKIARGEPRPNGSIPPAMTLWLYLPSKSKEVVAPHSLPCVLIAPAGTPLIHGIGLVNEGEGGGDQPEHLPWVRQGFAVLAYSLDGEMAGGEANDLSEIIKASKSFLAARAGLTNARIALEWLHARVPEVDPERLYTAGHSSAGTLAFLLAENEPRIKALVAFAPAVDVAAAFDRNEKRRLISQFAGFNAFFIPFNPARHLDQLHVPIYLFCARDDQNISINQDVADKLKLQRKELTFVTVPSGGHYKPMIDEGLPRAIDWLKPIDQGIKIKADASRVLEKEKEQEKGG